MESKQRLLNQPALSLLCSGLLILLSPSWAESGQPPAPSLLSSLPSLQSYSGIWQMPSARVLPDWHLRFQYGTDRPYHYYGAAVGLFDRLELHGQFTRIETLAAFPGEGYGDYKDRGAGVRLVLLKEGPRHPQLAVGAFDITGTALFSNRYLVASKTLGAFDFTIGLGQGTLAGEYVRDRQGSSDPSFSFLSSGPGRRTRPFAGVSRQLTPKLTVAAEYSSLQPEQMFGYRDHSGRVLLEDREKIPLNLGIKYRITPKLHARLALMGGHRLAGGISTELPLRPEGLLPWKKPSSAPVGERLRWQAHLADRNQLATILGELMQEEGFSGVAVSIGPDAAWIEAVNSLHLSDSLALGRMAALADRLLPPTIDTLYLNLKLNLTIIQSLRTTRVDLRAFQQGEIDQGEYLRRAALELHAHQHWREFSRPPVGAKITLADPRFSWELNPRLKTFLNNRRGFFKHKGLLEARIGYRLRPGTQLVGELELTLFNQWDQLAYTPLEPEPTRTDLTIYEEQSRPRISQLALNQHFDLPGGWQGVAGAGIFESAYLGFTVETFRYFADGRWGVGLESQGVRKRHPSRNFDLNPDHDHWYRTAFLNLYANLLPEQGVEAAVKIGRFLAGDPGVRFELRRSYQYFTIGGWYTITDTSRFTAAKNRDDRQHGVYISFPLALFKDRDIRGQARYTIATFTQDPGQTVRRPVSLNPLNPWSTPLHTRQNLPQMRVFAP